MAKEELIESVRQSMTIPKRSGSSKYFIAKEQFDSDPKQDTDGMDNLLSTGIGNFNMNLG